MSPPFLPPYSPTIWRYVVRPAPHPQPHVNANEGRRLCHESLYASMFILMTTDFSHSPNIKTEHFLRLMMRHVSRGCMQSSWVYWILGQFKRSTDTWPCLLQSGSSSLQVSISVHVKRYLTYFAWESHQRIHWICVKSRVRINKDVMYSDITIKKKPQLNLYVYTKQLCW